MSKVTHVNEHLLTYLTIRADGGWIVCDLFALGSTLCNLRAWGWLFLISCGWYFLPCI